jgi:hypothetical protein
MYYDDNYNPVEPNDYDDLEKKFKKDTNEFLNQDKGFNVITRKVVSNKTGRMKSKNINIYTSSVTGTKIRDAENGQYYNNKVGSKDEDFFFKVILATGECKSANSSSTLFYCSPQHYMNHLHSEVSSDIITGWEAKRDKRLKEIKEAKSKKGNVSVK